MSELFFSQCINVKYLKPVIGAEACQFFRSSGHPSSAANDPLHQKTQVFNNLKLSKDDTARFTMVLFIYIFSDQVLIRCLCL